uniref:Transcriptional regulator, TetR family n=1 Tax=Sphingobacterium sp. (strain 21) TaxID=743722 RepID=F4C9T1_SPHS2
MKKDKEKTMERLLEAVGLIIKSEGFKGLGINKIARISGVDKKLIYVYFGGFDALINSYLIKNDSWINFAKLSLDAISKAKFTSKRNILNFYLEKQFITLKESKLSSRLFEWSVSDDKASLDKLEKERDNSISELFSISDNHFLDTNINYRAVFAVLISAINYLAIKSNMKNKKLCDLDLGHEYDSAEVINAIKMINAWAFEFADREKDTMHNLAKFSQVE